MNASVLYEDSACMVLNKPAGILVHPGSGTDERETMLNFIEELFAERSLPFSEDAVLVHRLDKDTTGCLLVAKTAEAHSLLQKQFSDRSIAKSYLAVVSGAPEHREAVIDSPVGRNLTDRKKMSVLRTSVSREAQTTYRVLDSANDASLLECKPHTGRTHQIRVHLSSIGHPILGDETYGSPASKKVSEGYSVIQITLHAWKLSFSSPDAGEQSVEAPLPASFLEALTEVGLSVDSVA